MNEAIKKWLPLGVTATGLALIIEITTEQFWVTFFGWLGTLLVSLITSMMLNRHHPSSNHHHNNDPS